MGAFLKSRLFFSGIWECALIQMDIILNMTPKKPNGFINKICYCIPMVFLFLMSGTIHLYASARILSIPFTVMPQSRQSFAQQVNHTISFTLMHRSDVKIVQSKRLFSSSDLLAPNFQKKISQIGSDQNCSHVIYGSINIYGQHLSMNAVLLESSKQTVVYQSNDTLHQIEQIPDWLNQWLETALKKITNKKTGKTLTTNAHVQIENIADEIIGMDIADIDHDSDNEILLYGPKHIRMVDTDFQTINIRHSKPGKTVVFARWIDSYQNTSFLVVSETTGSDIITGLYQWKVNQWHLFQSYSGWFLTFLQSSNKLIAQQRRYSDYWGDIMHMQGQIYHTLVPHKYNMPIKADIFDFKVMTVKKQPLFIQFDKDARLNVFRNQSLLWRSSQSMGGSIHFMEVQKDTGQIDSTIHRYFPSRVIVCDLDNDQSDEIIVCENMSTTGRLFEKFRWFSQGVVHIMSWTGSELHTVWTSKKQPGPVTAYALEKNDTHWRLWIACVLKQQNIFRKGLSRIAAYEIQ